MCKKHSRTTGKLTFTCNILGCVFTQWWLLINPNLDCFACFYLWYFLFCKVKVYFLKFTHRIKVAANPSPVITQRPFEVISSICPVIPAVIVCQTSHRCGSLLSIRSRHPRTLAQTKEQRRGKCEEISDRNHKKLSATFETSYLNY